MNNFIERVWQYGPEIFLALKETAIMLVIAMCIGMLIGLPMGTLLYLSRKEGVAPNQWLYRTIDIYINVIRSFPFLLFVVMLIPLTRMIIGTSFGAYAAAFPLSFVAVAIYARLVEQVLLDVPVYVVELAQSLGATRIQIVTEFLYVEARSGLILSAASVLISLISYSTVMGVVGGGGIGDFAIRYGYQRYEYDLMYVTIALMIALVFFLQGIGMLAAKKLDKRK